MKVVIEYLVLHEVLQSVHLWHSAMKYMPEFSINRTSERRQLVSRPITKIRVERLEFKNYS